MIAFKIEPISKSAIPGRPAEHNGCLPRAMAAAAKLGGPTRAGVRSVAFEHGIGVHRDTISVTSAPEKNWPEERNPARVIPGGVLAQHGG